MDLFRRIFHIPKKLDGNLFEQFYWAMEEYDACDNSIADISSSNRDDMVAFLSRTRSMKNNVMTLIFAIRDEVLPAHLHANRDYRNKFSSDVLQDPQLLGRVWLSAEFFASRGRTTDAFPLCDLAREFLLCLLFVSLHLKNHAKEGVKTPSPIVLHALLNFDRIHAYFEQVVIQQSTPTKSEEEYYYLQDLAVLFSVTLERALKQELVTQEQVENYDPSLIFVIPRLGIFCGLTIFPDGPLNPSNFFRGSLNHLFRPHRRKIKKLRLQLQKLGTAEKCLLERKLAGLSTECNTDCSPSKESPTWEPKIVHNTGSTGLSQRQQEETTAQNLFVRISALSDQLQSKNAEDLTLVLKWVFGMALPPTDLSVESAEEALPNSPSFLNPPQAEAEWVPDEISPSCFQCQTPFTVFLRRHHCRSCGNVYCYRCSSNFVPLPPYPRPVRVCDRCVKLDV